jgi:antibiotic biosynthesis monooxygenase (ABM) superfamily enzyme
MEKHEDAGGEGAPRSVITRVVKAGHEKMFEDWLHGISQEAALFPGHLSVTIFRPPPGGREYVIVLQFDRPEHLGLWLDSDVRRSWIERSQSLTEEPERRAETTGLEHWFTLPGRPQHPAPARLKMAALTVLAAYPTILGLGIALRPLLERVPHLLGALIVTTCLTLLLTYVLMPNVTRLFYDWLYPRAAQS